MIDRAFIATNFEIEEMDDNPDRSLQRFEFIEILFRIAEIKYKLNKQASTFNEAFDKILHENVFKYCIPPAWQSFRNEHLWKLEPHDVLEVNQLNLLKIHNWTMEKKGPTGRGAFDKTISLATETQLKLDRARALHCFGMSKMTVKDENKNAAIKFNVLQPVEFYEYIGRLAAEKYKERTEMTLAEKICRTMDLIFPTFGITRNRLGEVEVDDDCSSDDSVHYDEVDLSKRLLEEDESEID